MERLQAVQSDDDGERELGIVGLDHHGRLSVEHETDPTLTDLVERMNEKESLLVEAPPPPDAPRFTLASSRLTRTDPGFVDALKTYLHTYYKLDLRPVPLP